MRLKTILTLALVLTPGVQVFSPTVSSAQDGPQDRYIVKLRPPSGGGPLVEAYDSIVGRGGKIHYVFEEPLWGFAATISSSTLSRLRADSFVISIDSDQYVTPPMPVASSAGASNYDPGWSLSHIGATEVPSDGANNVSVYVLDTGIRTTHKEFSSRATMPGDADFMSDENDRGDCNGHGTHVADLIGGEKYGVARGVHLIGVRVIACDGFGTISSLLKGLLWVRSHAQAPSVINLSLGVLEGKQSADVNAIVSDLVQRGFPVVVAAGNDGEDACQHAPGANTHAITVAAIDRQDRRPAFSNFGRCVKIFAPGARVYAANAASDRQFTVRDGTSMSAAIVSGVIALLLQQNPAATPAEIEQKLIAASATGIKNLGGSPDRRLTLPH